MRPMPIPDFDSDGLLPSAIYECSVDECIARFGEYMQSDCRAKLAHKLRRFFVDVERTGLVIAVFVDGSFVTTKAAMWT